MATGTPFRYQSVNEMVQEERGWRQEAAAELTRGAPHRPLALLDVRSPGNPALRGDLLGGSSEDEFLRMP